MQQTVGLHFVVPHFVEPNGVQKSEPIFQKNVNIFVIFSKKLFLLQHEQVDLL